MIARMSHIYFMRFQVRASHVVEISLNNCFLLCFEAVIMRAIPVCIDSAHPLYHIQLQKSQLKILLQPSQ